MTDPEGIPVQVEMTERGDRLIARQASEQAYDRALAYARTLGAEHGANAAEWYVQDTIGGRVSGDPVKAARYILRGIEDGDSAITDGFPFADLSGQWADTLTGPQLEADALDAAGVHDGDGLAEDMEWFTDICDAYESAFSEATETAIATAARAILA
jgi:hypothetical protein